MPEHGARSLLLEMEQVHFAAEFSVVASLRLFEPLQIGVEFLPFGESRGVDARKHRALGIAAPVGAGDLHQFERVADLAGRSHVRAAAEVRPLALRVELDLLIGGNGVDQFDLEGLALGLEIALRLVAADGALGERLIARDDFAHLLLDRGKILGRERRVAEEVVIEAVFDDRADGHLRARPQSLHGLGQHMRGVVADQLQRARIVAIEELDLRIGLDGVGEIVDDAIERHRDGALGERQRNGFDDFDACDAGRIFPARAIGKSDVDHERSFGLTRRNGPA